MAQLSLANFLANKDVPAELRNPVEAYAWMVTSGSAQDARRLRATLNASEAQRTDRLAEEYRSKYSPIQASPAGQFLRVTHWLVIVWPGLVILLAFLLARKRLARKTLFVLSGSVVSWLSQNIALGVLALAINPVTTHWPEAMLNGIIGVYALSFLLGLLAPLLAVFALYRFWRYKNWLRDRGHDVETLLV